MASDTAFKCLNALKLEFDAMRSCLFAEGFLTPERYAAALHRYRFEEACRMHPYPFQASFNELADREITANSLAPLLGCSELHAFVITSSSLYSSMKAETSRRRVENEVVIVVGGAAGAGVMPTVELFDPATRQWTLLPQMHQPRHRHAATVIGRRLFVTGGRSLHGQDADNDTTHLNHDDDEFILNSVESFDTSSCRWSELPPMYEARAAHVAVNLDGSLCVLGGFRGNHHGSGDHYMYELGDREVWPEENTMERFDLREDCWDILPPIPGWRGRSMLNSTAVVIKGRLYLCCGNDAANYNRGVDIFDPRVQLWTSLEDCQVGCREHHAAVVYAEVLYLFGGKFLKRVLDTAVRFDPVSQRCEPLPPMPTPRCRFGAVVVGERICVSGGDDGVHALTSTLTFVPASGHWETLLPMSSASRRYAAISVVQKLYIFGGCDGNERDLDSVQCFDPASGEWIIQQSMRVSRRGALAFKVPRFRRVTLGSTIEKNPRWLV